VDGRVVCIANTRWEEYRHWDCEGNDLISFPKPVWNNGDPASKEARLFCAEECIKRSTCVAFNYPDQGVSPGCWLKQGARQKSQELGVDCGELLH
jgi:hypothetical protein